jgi:hypothetical protein
MSHALLSPSGSYRWVACPGSPRLSRGAVDSPSVYAADGTCSHWIASEVLNGRGAPPVGAVLEFDGFKFTVEEERLARVKVYTDAMQRLPGVHFVEQHLDLTAVYGVESWGTADHIAADLDTKTLTVSDLKDGSQRVDAENNFQLLSYALGALWDLRWLSSDFERFVLEIHQPKLDHISEWKLSLRDILSRGMLLRGSAENANELLTASDERVRENLVAGAHCKWCPAAGSCPELAASVAAEFEVMPHPRDIFRLTDAELGAYLNKEAYVLNAFAQFRAEALGRARVGSTIPGWKLAQGRAGNAKWSDEPNAEKLLNSLLAGNAYDRKLISPTTARKRLKGQDTAEVEKLITRSEGQLTLVPEADARAAVVAGAEEFAIVNTET